MCSPVAHATVFSSKLKNSNSFPSGRGYRECQKRNGNAPVFQRRLLRCDNSRYRVGFNLTSTPCGVSPIRERLYLYIFSLVCNSYISLKNTEGQWKDDQRHGKGKLTYVNGLQYEVRLCWLSLNDAEVYRHKGDWCV